jgi:hypothetical protein
VKHPERVEGYLEHIIQAIDRATRYIAQVEDVAALQREEQTQDAGRRRAGLGSLSRHPDHDAD